MNSPSSGAARPRVLCVDDDRDVAEVVQAILSDEGYEVSCLYELDEHSLRRAVGMLEPDCVLLDGVPGLAYESWGDAAWLEQRSRPVPTIMLTAHHVGAAEAREGDTQRSRDAGFVAMVEKPFHVEDLLTAVAKAVGQSKPFDASTKGVRFRSFDHRISRLPPNRESCSARLCYCQDLDSFYCSCGAVVVKRRHRSSQFTAARQGATWWRATRAEPCVSSPIGAGEDRVLDQMHRLIR